MEINKVLQMICQAISDKKGENVVVLDVRGVCSLTDYFIVAEGFVPRHVSAIARNVLEVLETEGFPPIHIEGLSEGSWIVLDYFDIVVHFFTSELRSHYAFEEIWKEGKVVSVDVDYGLSQKLSRQ